MANAKRPSFTTAIEAEGTPVVSRRAVVEPGFLLDVGDQPGGLLGREALRPEIGEGLVGLIALAAGQSAPILIDGISDAPNDRTDTGTDGRAHAGDHRSNGRADTGTCQGAGHGRLPGVVRGQALMGTSGGQTKPRQAEQPGQNTQPGGTAEDTEGAVGELQRTQHELALTTENLRAAYARLHEYETAAAFQSQQAAQPARTVSPFAWQA